MKGTEREIKRERETVRVYLPPNLPTPKPERTLAKNRVFRDHLSQPFLSFLGALDHTQDIYNPRRQQDLGETSGLHTGDLSKSNAVIK